MLQTRSAQVSDTPRWHSPGFGSAIAAAKQKNGAECLRLRQFRMQAGHRNFEAVA